MEILIAPPLRVGTWIDREGELRPPLSLSELGPAYKILFCFQHWCPGCHSNGFPTLVAMVSGLAGGPHGFAVIQTVFEGEAENGFDRLRENQLRYGLHLPFGHDVSIGQARIPTIMQDYHTMGTPWFIIINPREQVVFSDFHLDAGRAIEALRMPAF